jgi:hypothetical protein
LPLAERDRRQRCPARLAFRTAPTGQPEEASFDALDEADQA